MITSKIEIRAVSDDETQAVIAVVGLSKGLGNSVGNALRRTLLSEIPGYAPQAYWIRNMKKFSTIPGVVESTIEIDKNISNIRLKVSAREGVVVPREFYIGFKGFVQKSLFAGDLAVFTDRLGEDSLGLVYGVDWWVTILNKDACLMTCGTEQSVNTHLLVKCGSGLYFSSSQERVKIEYNDVDLGDITSGFVTVKSDYSPVLSAMYYVEEGDSKFTETLVLDVKTTGAITPSTAINIACQINAAIYMSIPAASIYLPQIIGDKIGIALAGIPSSYPEWTNELRVTEEVFQDTKEVTKNLSNPIELLSLDSIYQNLFKTNKVDTIEDLKYAVETSSVDEMLNKYNGLYTANNKVQLSKTYIITRLAEFGIKCNVN